MPKGGTTELRAVLFTDIVGSTEIARELGDERWSELLARQRRIVRQELKAAGGREVDTAGDGFFAIFSGPADAIRCGIAAADIVRSLGVDIRAGVHFGEIDTSGGGAHGIVVHTGARVMSEAGAAEVLITQTVKDLVAGSRFELEDRGVHELKGVPGNWALYRVAILDQPAPQPLDPQIARERRDAITLSTCVGGLRDADCGCRSSWPPRSSS